MLPNTCVKTDLKWHFTAKRDSLNMLVSIFCLSNYSQSSAKLLAGIMPVLSFWTERTRPTASLPWITTKCKPVTLPPTAISEPQSFMCFHRLSQNAAGSETHHSRCVKLADPVSFCGYLLLHINTYTHFLTHIYWQKYPFSSTSALDW